MIGKRRVWLDRSPAVLLAACACGWRENAADAAHGWRLLAHHVDAVHDDAARRRAFQTNAIKAARRGRNGIQPADD